MYKQLCTGNQDLSAQFVCNSTCKNQECLNNCLLNYERKRQKFCSKADRKKARLLKKRRLAKKKKALAKKKKELARKKKALAIKKRKLEAEKKEREKKKSRKTVVKNLNAQKSEKAKLNSKQSKPTSKKNKGSRSTQNYSNYGQQGYQNNNQQGYLNNGQRSYANNYQQNTWPTQSDLSSWIQSYESKIERQYDTYGRSQPSFYNSPSSVLNDNYYSVCGYNSHCKNYLEMNNKLVINRKLIPLAASLKLQGLSAVNKVYNSNRDVLSCNNTYYMYDAVQRVSSSPQLFINAAMAAAREMCGTRPNAVTYDTSINCVNYPGSCATRYPENFKNCLGHFEGCDNELAAVNSLNYVNYTDENLNTTKSFQKKFKDYYAKSGLTSISQSPYEYCHAECKKPGPLFCEAEAELVGFCEMVCREECRDYYKTRSTFVYELTASGTDSWLPPQDRAKLVELYKERLNKRIRRVRLKQEYALKKLGNKVERGLKKELRENRMKVIAGILEMEAELYKEVQAVNNEETRKADLYEKKILEQLEAFYYDYKNFGNLPKDAMLHIFED